MEDCIFCQLSTSTTNRQLILETPNFNLIHDGFPLSTSHLLWIPKQHYLTFSSLSQTLLDETKEYLQKVSILFPQALFFEHGDCGQTVKHAHLHLVPCNVRLEALHSHLPVGKVTTLTDYSEINQFSHYLFIATTNKLVVIEPAAEVEPGVITNSLAALLGMPYPVMNRLKVSQEQLQQTQMVVKKGLGL